MATTCLLDGNQLPTGWTTTCLLDDHHLPTGGTTSCLLDMHVLLWQFPVGLMYMLCLDYLQQYVLATTLIPDHNSN